MVNAPELNVQSLKRSDLAAAAATLNSAFHDDPAWALVLDDPAVREKVYVRMWPALVRYAMRYGVARGIDGTAGVACWLPPGRTKVTAMRSLLSGLWSMMMVMDTDKRKEFMALLGQMDEAHERLVPEPHWYLSELATAPSRQGEGLATRLLEDGFERASADGCPVYLESITEPNTAYYERRGFEVLEFGEITPSGFPYWCMVWRP